MSQKRSWFKSKKYGWGWTPASWEGWALISTYIIILVLAAFLLLPHEDGGSIDTVQLVAFLLIVLSATFLLIGISMSKGGPPHFKLGDKDES